MDPYSILIPVVITAAVLVVAIPVLLVMGAIYGVRAFRSLERRRR